MKGAESRILVFWISVGMAIPVWLATFVGVGQGWLALEAPLNLRTWLWLVLFFPVAEELTFRGFLMSLFAKYLPQLRFGPITTCNLLTSALFSFAHITTRSLALGFLVFLPSLWLGWLKEKTGSLSTCVVVHCIWNLGFFLSAGLAVNF